MRRHEDFEWDSEKGRINRRKHRVSFEEGAAVLHDLQADRFHLEEFDDEHDSDEDRYVTFGSHPDDRSIILRIVWTDRSTASRRITRIISARAATKKERRRYAQELGGQ
jgi:uncharacterized DUF497 family protein